MLDSFGKRLKYCRFLIGLGAKDFVKELNSLNINVAYSAFNRWETDIVKFPSYHIVEKIIVLFKKLGLKRVTLEWLLYGDGYPPLPVYLDKFNEDEQTYILPSILSDKNNYITKTIVGNWALPIAISGSHLIINLITDFLSPHNLNKLIFYETIHQNFNLGILTKIENSIHHCIKNKEGFFIQTSEIKTMGRIVWIKYN